ncbi:MAG: tetraacyldisaccharide 4'-kinase [Deltaproteobacteria bacterium]|nr:tetraacyldisaccharide 4'-kinase [Deltaproteobacteria bacterium]
MACFFLLLLLSFAYRALVLVRKTLYGWGILRVKRLPLKVVCVGNLTMGGTGKTPTVEYVSCLLKKAGLNVAVLSRGYRGSREKEGGVVSDGSTLLLSEMDSGDEAYMLARRLDGVPVLVGRNRYRSGRTACERFGTEVAVLDDGFQHIQLDRDLDILLVDGREGFGSGRLFPLGPLREPLAGLARADHFLITKGKDRNRAEAIEEALRRWNREAGIFHGRYVPESLIDPKTGQPSSPGGLSGKKILAFSGLASPDHFFELLESLGAALVGEIVFADHHRYTERDLAFIRSNMSGAEWTVTTEKDMVRLEGLNFDELPLRVLTIRLEINEEEDFTRALFSGLEIGDSPAPSRKRPDGRENIPWQSR